MGFLSTCYLLLATCLDQHAPYRMVPSVVSEKSNRGGTEGREGGSTELKRGTFT
jgi:hypothetical protein